MSWLQSQGIRPVVALALLLAATLGAVALWPVTMAHFGIPLAQGRWFADTYSVLASSDAFAAGLDPYRPNPLDPMHAPHWYTDWWFWLHDFGLTRADAIWVGMTVTLSFLAAVVLLVRPKSWGEVLSAWLIGCSPAVVLGLNRANPDILIVAMLAAVAWLLASPRRPRWLLGPPLLAFLTGLKFYPLVGCVALLFVRRPKREIVGSLLFMLVLGALVGAAIADDFFRVMPSIEHELGVFTFGGGQLLRLIGWSPSLVGISTLVLGAAVLAGAGWRSAPAPAALPEREVVAFVLGSSVLLGCFWLGFSYAYRLAFLVLTLPLLWRWCRSADDGRNRRWAVWTLLLAVVLTWLDGLVVLALNLRGAPPAGWTIAEMEQAAGWLVHSLAWVWAACTSRLLIALCRRQWQEFSARNDLNVAR